MYTSSDTSTYRWQNRIWIPSCPNHVQIGNIITKIHTRIVNYMRAAWSAQTVDNPALLMTSTPFVRLPHDYLDSSWKNDRVRDTEQGLLMNTLSHSDVPVFIPIHLASTPFGRSRGFSEWLREDTFRRWRHAHEKGVRHHADASDEANADRWRCVY